MGYHGWVWVVRGVGLLGGAFFLRWRLHDDAISFIIGVAIWLIAFVIAGVKLACLSYEKLPPELLQPKNLGSPHRKFVILSDDYRYFLS